jgi:hypothetical protein
MRVPVRYAPLLFSAMLSSIMVSIVSFPTVALVAPAVRRVVARVTA